MENNSSIIVRSPHKLFYLIAVVMLVAGLAVTGFSKPVLADNPNEMVTLCHAAGQEGTTQFVTLTIAWPAAYGQAGHFNEDGTPKAGHENDYLGPCTVITQPPTVTICYNGETLEVNEDDLGQYDGYTEGECVIPPNMVTICYDNETLSVDESTLGQYEGYTEGSCPVPPTTVTICYNNDTIVVDENLLEQYSGYTLGDCKVVGEGTPVPTLSVPVAVSSNILIPVTGLETKNVSASDTVKQLFFNLAFVFAGLGLVFQGISKKN